MRDIFTEIFENQPLDPREAARRGARPTLRKQFYQRAHVGEAAPGGFPLKLDGKPVRTPARRPLAAPTVALAGADRRGVERAAGGRRPGAHAAHPARQRSDRRGGGRAEPVADEVVQYLGSDLLCYRAEAPDGLVESQTRHWDPVLAWARDTLGARFVLGQGVVHVAQPDETIAALRATIPAEPWRLGALSVITTLTGSGLLALALARGAIEPEAAWAAAHVDEDWQMVQWGRDDDALERRAYRRAEFDAAATVLRLTK